MIGSMLALALGLQPTEAQCNAVGPALPPGCTAWTSLFRDSEVELLADPASVRRNDNGFDLMIRVVFSADQVHGMRSGVTTQRFDCRAQTSTILNSRYYDAGGRLIVAGSAPEEPVPATPGSPDRLALDRWCAPAR